MIRLRVLIAACILLPGALSLPASLLGQTTVDRLVVALDSLTGAAYDNWRMSPDLRSYTPPGDPAAPGFDDRSWQNLRLNQSVYPDSCWLRKEIIVPQHFLGQPVKGSLRFLVAVDDYGSLWVNGEPRGHFPWNGDFELTPAARPGERFVIAIKAVNTGGPLRLLRAELQIESAKNARQAIEDFSLSLRTGQKLLSFDTYQTAGGKKEDPGIDRTKLDREERKRLSVLLQSEAARLDLTALARGDLIRFQRSLDSIRTALAPVGAFAKRFTLFFDSNAHIDAAWLWREKETVEVCNHTFGSVLNMMKARPDFTYTQSSALYYEWMEQLYPDLFASIRDLVRQGRWEPTGGMWVEPDCNLPSGESWVRHLLYAKRYFRQKLGTDVKIGWNPDSFGYTVSMPALYRNAGIDAFITQKIGWNDTNVFPHRLFWWQSPDGSRILSYFPFDYVNTAENPFAFVDWLRQYEANTGLRKLMILFGIGNHGGGPSLAMLARIDRLRGLDIFPAIEHGTATQYLDWVRSNDLSGLPVWNDELYLEYHRGTYTTQAAMKHYNRTGETLLTNAEKFASLASLEGDDYPAAMLEDAWKTFLTLQFHDILPGSSIHEVYDDARATHEEVRKLGGHLLENSLDRLVRSINTRGMSTGTPVVVFNPLAWARTDLVRLPLPVGDSRSFSIVDGSGKGVPSQISVSGKYEREILFVARNVPSLGYTTFLLRPAEPSARSVSLNASTWRLENSRFVISVDSTTGWIRSIVDRRGGERELLSGPGNELQLLEDRPAQWDAWNIGLTGVRFPSQFRGASIVEQGPVRVVLRLRRDYLKPGTRKEYPTEDFPTSFFTQDIALYEELDRIEFVTTADWWEDHTMVKVAFPLTVTDTVATYEVPFGTIERSTQLRTSWEKARVEVPASRWADVSAGGYGISLLNTDKYGYDIKGRTMRLSLLRSPTWPDPMADRGMHTTTYYLYPHSGTWSEGGTVRQGYEVNVPLLGRATDAHPGRLPRTHSFLSLSPSTLILTSVKKAEDSDAWVVQWYNAGSADVEAMLTLPFTPTRAMRSDFLESAGEIVQTKRTSLRVLTAPRSIVTVKAER